MIRKAWFHCFSGIAGDMAFGSLVDAGADQKEIVFMLNKLELPDWKISFEKSSSLWSIRNQSERNY